MIADLASRKVKSAYLRITLTRVTTAFFLFSFFHCFAQGIINSLLFSVDMEYSSVLSGIIQEAQIPPKAFTFLEGHPGNYHLQICNDIPHEGYNPCVTIFQSGQDNNTVLSLFQRAVVKDSSGDIITNRFSNGVNLTLPGGQTNFLNEQCTQILLWPQQTLRNARREDLASVALQFWLFSVSFIAIMYDSIPHTLAALSARVLVTAWSAYTIWRTRDMEVRFSQLFIDPNTPCHINLFPGYFTTRTSYEIPDLVLNCTALVFSSYLSWSLTRTYQRQTFKRIGAPKNIIRLHRFFMAVLACLQLAVFVLVTATSLWVDELLNTAMDLISAHTPIYTALFVFTTIALLPWISMGWYSIRHERKHLMVSFLFIAFIFIIFWSIMFYSLVYRWTFTWWPYLACVTSASFVVLIATIVLGGMCWWNFNQGLAQYLRAEHTLASLDFEPEVFPHDVEKGSKQGALFDDETPTPLYYLPTLHLIA